MWLKRTIIRVPALMLLACTGCATMTPGELAAVSPVSDRSRVGNVYLLRGFIGIFSEGIDRLGEKIDRQDIASHVFQDGQWSALAKRLVEQYQTEPQHEPIVLIGHSYGADDSIRIARKLDAAGIPVELLVTLDPVTPPAVPKNVKRCVNLYQSNGVFDTLPWLRGIPLKQEAGAAGTLVNANLRTDRPDLLEPNLDHFNIEKKEKVHAEVVRLVLQVCLTREAWATARGLPLPLVKPVPAVEPRPRGPVAGITAPPGPPKHLGRRDTPREPQ